MLHLAHTLYYTNTTLCSCTFTVTSILVSVDWYVTTGFGLAMLLIGLGIGFILRGYKLRSVKTSEQGGPQG